MMTDRPRIPISVIIPSKNEERNLRDCLASIDWADDVFVVDSQSTDGTVALAEQWGAHVIQFHYDGGWPKKKNWSLENIRLKYDWVLILDADERVSDELRDEMLEAVRDGRHVGYYIRWQFFFLGREMKNCWDQGWMLRLFRHRLGRYEDLGMREEGGWDNEVHENIIVEGPTDCLKSHLVHHSTQSLSFWIRKQNEFSDWNAVRRMAQLREPMPSPTFLVSSDPLRRRKFLKAFYLRLPGKPLFMFLLLYLFRRGFLDGKAGLYFCALRAMHELNISAKMFEKKLGAAAANPSIP